MAGEGWLDIIESSCQYTANDLRGNRFLPGTVGGFQGECKVLFHLQRGRQRVSQEINGFWR
jgi:hypothetical protein